MSLGPGKRIIGNLTERPAHTRIGSKHDCTQIVQWGAKETGFALAYPLSRQRTHGIADTATKKGPPPWPQRPAVLPPYLRLSTQSGGSILRDKFGYTPLRLASSSARPRAAARISAQQFAAEPLRPWPAGKPLWIWNRELPIAWSVPLVSSFHPSWY